MENKLRNKLEEVSRTVPSSVISKEFRGVGSETLVEDILDLLKDKPLQEVEEILQVAKVNFEKREGYKKLIEDRRKILF